MNTQESDKKSQALLKVAISNHNAKRYNEAAGFYEFILKRYPNTEAAQYAKTNLGSLVNKVNGLEPIQPYEPLIAQIEQSINSKLVPNESAKISDPISVGALGFLRVIGWAIAILGVISGIIVLVNAPKAPLYSNQFEAQIMQMARLAYLSVGLGQIIGSIVTGTLFNVIASIGNTVLDIWKAQQTK